MEFKTFATTTAAIFVLAASHLIAAAPTFSVIHSFGVTGDGSDSNARLIADANGILYGTTGTGGSFGQGTVFSLSPATSQGSPWTETILWNFGGAADGQNPAGALALGPDGTLYGATAKGGSQNCGSVFSLGPPPSPGNSWNESIIWNFQCTPDGSDPLAPTLGPGGVLYVPTSTGGAGNFGAVFSLTPPSNGGSWSEALLYSFGNSFGGCSGACYPASPLSIDSAGTLYGATLSGGSCPACGAIFSLAPGSQAGAPWTEQQLYLFTGGRTDGTKPSFGCALAVSPSGVIYGTTYGGGRNNGGTVFALAPPSEPGGRWSEAVLHEFGKVNGIASRGMDATGLTLDLATGALYGTTGSGGASATAKKLGYGTVFELTPPGTGPRWSFRLLHSFTREDGAHPRNGVALLGGSLYGSTPLAGADGVGNIFAVVP